MFNHDVYSNLYARCLLFWYRFFHLHDEEDAVRHHFLNVSVRNWSSVPPHWTGSWHCVCVCVCVCAHARVCVCTHVCISMPVCMCALVCVYACAYVYMYICCVYMCVCECVCPAPLCRLPHCDTIYYLSQAASEERYYLTRQGPENGYVLVIPHLSVV